MRNTWTIELKWICIMTFADVINFIYIKHFARYLHNFHKSLQPKWNKMMHNQGLYAYWMANEAWKISFHRWSRWAYLFFSFSVARSFLIFIEKSWRIHLSSLNGCQIFNGRRFFSVLIKRSRATLNQNVWSIIRVCVCVDALYQFRISESIKCDVVYQTLCFQLSQQIKKMANGVLGNSLCQICICNFSVSQVHSWCMWAMKYEYEVLCATRTRQTN